MFRDMNDAFPILIIEDDPSSRKLLEKTLVTSGYHVVSAENGHNALEILEKNFFKLL